MCHLPAEHGVLVRRPLASCTAHLDLDQHLRAPLCCSAADPNKASCKVTTWVCLCPFPQPFPLPSRVLGGSEERWADHTWAMARPVGRVGPVHTQYPSAHKRRPGLCLCPPHLAQVGAQAGPGGVTPAHPAHWLCQYRRRPRQVLGQV